MIPFVIFAAALIAQDSREALGPKDRGGKAGPHPLLQLMQQKKSALRPELKDQHPRVIATSAEIEGLRVRARTTHADLWQQALADLREKMKQEPPAAPAQTRRIQNGVGIAIAGFALAYQVEQKPEFLAAAKKYMDAAVSYDIWGYANSKPNVDLAAGHLLYGLGLGYDLLYHQLDATDRARYRESLKRHANLVAEYFKPKPGRTFAYSQNHTFIPIAGLAIAAYALAGEVPEAAEWAALSRAIFDRVLETYSADGYYYEGFEYWVFSTPWIVHYLDAHLHSTGEDLFDRPGLRDAHLYVAHSVLPDGRNIFDFGDAFEGANTRSGESEDAKRTHPGGHLESNFNILYRLAQRFQSSDAQAVADWLKQHGQVNAENFWSLLWFDEKIKTNPIQSSLPPYHYFADQDVVFWRSSWAADATAIAIKCGPPEGHQSASLSKRLPDWHLESGHAHPDAGSFILFGRGQYLTGDSGYAGVPKTDQHNSLLINGMGLINGKGQESPGATHNAFLGVSLERLNQIRVVRQSLARDRFEVTTDFAAAYDPTIGIRKLRRDFVWSERGELSITDQIETAAPAVITWLVQTDSQPISLSSQEFRPGRTCGLLSRNLMGRDSALGRVWSPAPDHRGQSTRVK